MKICDILGTGGRFAEIVVVNYVDETILLGHDGPFHIAISEGKPILRGMWLYHGKQGTGKSVRQTLLAARVRSGTTIPITHLFHYRIQRGIAADLEYRMHFIHHRNIT